MPDLQRPHQSRKSIRRLLLAALVWAAVAVVIPAGARADVSLVDPPSQLELDAVVASGGTVPLSVRNDDKQPQRIEARLVGLAAATPRGATPAPSLAPSNALSDVVPPGGTDIVALSLDATSRPVAGTYKGTLVAAGALGGEDTAPVSIVVTAAAPPPATPVAPARVMPPYVKDFTVSGVNFVPSLLDPLPSATLGFGVLLAILLLPFVSLDFAAMGRFRRSGLRPKGLKGWHVVVGFVIAACLIAIGWCASFRNADNAFFDGKGVHAIEMARPPVDSSAPTGVVGGLIDDDGTPAMVVVKDGRLLTRDIHRAGAYVGNVDLLAAAGVGEAKMTANVRDYWPWALLFIAIGVALGAWVTRYFAVKRGRTKVTLAIMELREEIQVTDAALQEEDVDRNYSVKARLDARLARVEARLGFGDPEETKTALEDLKAIRTYFEAAQEMLRDVERLPAARDKVRALAKEHGFDAAEVGALASARHLLATPFDDGLPDEKSEDLTKRAKAVGDTLAVLTLLADWLPQAAQMRDVVGSTTAPPGAGAGAKKVPAGQQAPDEQKALDDAKAAFNKALHDLLAAGSPESATTHLSELLAAFGTIRNLPAIKDVPEAKQAFAKLQAVPELADGGGPDAPVRVPRVSPAIVQLSPDQQPSAVARRKFLATDRQMTLVTGLLAVFSGLTLLYATSPTWGSPSDYLKALLWGSVVSEGAKQVTALVTRTGLAAGL